MGGCFSDRVSPIFVLSGIRDIFPVRPAICFARMILISLQCTGITFHTALAARALTMSQSRAPFLWPLPKARGPPCRVHLQRGRWCCLAGNLKDQLFSLTTKMTDQRLPLPHPLLHTQHLGYSWLFALLQLWLLLCTGLAQQPDSAAA